jgi:TPR repeat protein
MLRRFHHSLVLLVVLTFAVTATRAQNATSVGNLPLPELQKLANRGDPAAQNELGLRYRLGSDVEKDPAKAIPWFLKAARQGYAKAYFNLGAAYYNGDGVPRNDQDSCVWFILSADAGDPRGQEAVERTRQEESPRRLMECEVTTGTAYVTGDVIKTDYDKAMKWYLKAANAGDGIACEKIAYLYDRGLGVPQDKKQSFDWLKRSADLGYAVAIFELGRAYEIGDGVRQDVPKAKKLYEQASAYGQPEALIALGTMYAEGHGAKLDREKALTYYIVAANYGNPEGKRLAGELATQLSPKQVSEAKEDAHRFEVSTKRPLVLVPK